MVFTLGWMLFDVSRLSRELDELRGRAVSGADQIGKICKAVATADKIYPVLLRFFT